MEGREKEAVYRTDQSDLQALSKETGVEYDEVQLQAIEEAIRSKGYGADRRTRYG
ncbi:MAG: hypothetical protein ACLTOV_00785 [Phocaeicola sp.]